MALSEFLLNVRTAAIFFSPHLDFENPEFVPTDVPDAIRHADIWLKPQTVSGFDPEDFGYLGSNRAGELAERVDEFRRLAESVDGRAPTPDEVERTGAPLLSILSILRPNFDPRWLAVHRAIQRASPKFPDWVAGVFPVIDQDWEGEPIIRVYVTVADAELRPGRHVTLIRQFEGLIRDALRSAEIVDPFVVSLVAESDMAEVIGADEG